MMNEEFDPSESELESESNIILVSKINQVKPMTIKKKKKNTLKPKKKKTTIKTKKKKSTLKSKTIKKKKTSITKPKKKKKTLKTKPKTKNKKTLETESKKKKKTSITKPKKKKKTLETKPKKKKKTLEIETKEPKTIEPKTEEPNKISKTQEEDKEDKGEIKNRKRKKRTEFNDLNTYININIDGMSRKEIVRHLRETRQRKRRKYCKKKARMLKIAEIRNEIDDIPVSQIRENQIMNVALTKISNFAPSLNHIDKMSMSLVFVIDLNTYDTEDMINILRNTVTLKMISQQISRCHGIQKLKKRDITPVILSGVVKKDITLIPLDKLYRISQFYYRICQVRTDKILAVTLLHDTDLKRMDIPLCNKSIVIESLEEIDGKFIRARQKTIQQLSKHV